MRRPVESSRFSLRTSSGMPSPTPNTPRGRLSPPWMLSMPSRGKDAPCTDSEVKRFHLPTEHKRTNRPFSGPPNKTKREFLTFTIELYAFRWHLKNCKQIPCITEGKFRYILIVFTTDQRFVSSIQSRHCVVCNGYSFSDVLKVEAFYKTSWKWFSFSMPPRQFIYVYPLKSEKNSRRAICQLTLKRFCTFFFAQWNSRIWCIGSGKQKRSMPKGAEFSGEKFGYILITF